MDIVSSLKGLEKKLRKGAALSRENADVVLKILKHGKGYSVYLSAYFLGMALAREKMEENVRNAIKAGIALEYSNGGQAQRKSIAAGLAGADLETVRRLKRDEWLGNRLMTQFADYGEVLLAINAEEKKIKNWIIMHGNMFY